MKIEERRLKNEKKLQEAEEKKKQDFLDKIKKKKEIEK